MLDINFLLYEFENFEEFDLPNIVEKSLDNFVHYLHKENKMERFLDYINKKPK